MSAGAGLLVVNDVIIKTLTDDMPVTQLIAIRATMIAALCLMLTCRKGPWPRRAFTADVALRTAFTAGNVFAFVTAMSVLPFSVAVMLDLGSIIFVALAAPMVLGERLTLRTLATAVVALVGAALILSPQTEISGAWAFLPVLSGILGAGRELWTRKLRNGPLGAEQMTLMASVAMIAAAGIAGLGMGGWSIPDADDAALAALAGALQGGAMILMAKAMFAGTAATVAPFRLTGLIWALLLSFFFFAERLSVQQMVGIAVIIAALWVLTRGSQPRAGRPETPQ